MSKPTGKPNERETRAEETTRVANEMIAAEGADRDAKTARLRAAREAAEAARKQEGQH